MSTQLSPSVAGISVAQILPKAKLIGAKQVSVASCCGHWEDVQSGDVYVALVGSEVDGHQYVYEAVEKGAVAVVTERLLAVDIPQVVVSDTRQAYGEICQSLAGTPCRRMTTVGVSGTDGKTVTAHLINSILRSAGKNSGLMSSIEVSMGGGAETAPAKNGSTAVPQQQLNSPAIAEQLSRMVIEGCDHAVVEIPSRDLARRSIAGVGLDVAVLTNVRRDPQGFHGSSKNYKRAMLRLVEQLNPGGLVVINADDPKSHFLLDHVSNPLLTFGIKQDANITASVYERTAADQIFMITAGDQSVPVRTSIIGDHHVYNCLAAAAVGLTLGIDLQTIAQGLEAASPIAGRMERVECGQPYRVWVDSANSATQLANALRAVKQVCSGKIWCVCSVDENQTKHQRQMIGEVAAKAASKAIITQTTADPISDYEPIHQMLDGFQHPQTAQIIPNRFKAIEWALQQAGPGDAVVVTGSGERPFALVGEHNWTISDRDVCQAWLYDHASMLTEKFSNSDGVAAIYDINDYRG